MNTQRVIILGVAALAAGAAALLARGLLGGGAEKAKADIPPPRPSVAEVLVAATPLQPGSPLAPGSVRWQEWPKGSVDASFITQDTVPDMNRVIQGAVVRAPMVAGEPVTISKIVHAAGGGFMAAMVNPGMRAVSVGISTETGAGGFILPNDRVDVLVTEQVSETPKRFASRTLLTGVRVLAVDQTYLEDKDRKVVLAKTATLELEPKQGELVQRAQAAGTISLALRALGDDDSQKPDRANNNASKDDGDVTSAATIIRYGISHTSGGGDQGD